MWWWWRGRESLGSADAFGAASEEIETNAARASTASLALPTCSVFCAKGAGRGAEKEEPGGGGGGRGRAPGGEEGGGGRSDAAFVERRVERRGRRGRGLRAADRTLQRIKRSPEATGQEIEEEETGTLPAEAASAAMTRYSRSNWCADGSRSAARPGLVRSA